MWNTEALDIETDYHISQETTYLSFQSCDALKYESNHIELKV